MVINTLRPRQNGRHFTDDIFKCIFLSENVWIPIIISINFVPKGPVDNIPALVQLMAWRRPGDKPLYEPMMVSLTTHICVNRPQWVNMCVTQNPRKNAPSIYNLRINAWLVPLWQNRLTIQLKNSYIFIFYVDHRSNIRTSLYGSMFLIISYHLDWIIAMHFKSRQH